MTSPARAWSNVATLSLCQGLAMSASALVVTVTALVGRQLAPDAGLATLPLGLQYLTMTLAAVPIARSMQRFGRRLGFSLGHGAGVAGGLAGCQAVLTADFALYCLASVLIGLYVGHSFHHRFAAAETADTARSVDRDRALGLVLAGGVLAALAGPQLAAWSKDLFAPVTFAGSWLAVSGLAGLGLVVVQTLELPQAAVPRGRASWSQARRLLRRPAFALAMAAAAVAYAAMNLVMTVTPVAVLDCHLPFAAAAFVIQWHVFAMHAPSFFTGDLIRRLGARLVMGAGVALMTGSAAINAAGITLPHFLGALVLLGVGWNFLFVGATALLVRSYTQEEAAIAQGVNDTVLFATIAVSALGAGWLYDHFGWIVLNAAILVPLLVVAAGLTVMARPSQAVPIRAND